MHKPKAEARACVSLQAEFEGMQEGMEGTGLRQHLVGGEAEMLSKEEKGL